MFTAIMLELDLAEKDARDILEKEGIDPDQIGRHYFSGWPGTKIHYSDIGYLNPKLSDFGEAAHYTYRMLGAVMLMREMLQICRDDEERQRMVYSMNLGQFYTSTNVGLNIPEARKFFRVEHNRRNSTRKKGSEGSVKAMIRMIGEKQQDPSAESIIKVMEELAAHLEDDQKKSYKDCNYPLIIQDVDHDEEKVFYKNPKTKKEHDFKFKTIENYISQLFPTK